jgi:hypothetical protein
MQGTGRRGKAALLRYGDESSQFAYLHLPIAP